MGKTVLFLATTTGYQTRMFGEAAERLGVRLLFATDRCDRLDDPWADRAIPVRFSDEPGSLDAILRALDGERPAGVLAVGDRATTLAARTAQALNLPGHPREAAVAARDKRLTRERLRAAGLPTPWFTSISRHRGPESVAGTMPYPVVLKPRTLSGSRGVIRADTPEDFVAAFRRLQRLLDARDVRAMRDAATDDIQIEGFISGPEYAIEGILDRGRLYPLAIFDKPDPLDGPFFEETLYVTPSRASGRLQRDIVDAVAAAVRALGLHHGPIHAECRVNDGGVFVLEVAARPIGGLCAKALSFESEPARRIGLEELLLRHATGESPAEWRREGEASAVMMIPIQRGGIYRRTEGVDAARSVTGVTELHITAKPDQKLVPLPEGASYLGFIFARGASPDAVEHALREAHRRLTFVVDRDLPIVTTSS